MATENTKQATTKTDEIKEDPTIVLKEEIDFLKKRCDDLAKELSIYKNKYAKTFEILASVIDLHIGN
jgi:hypothetical protein